jgi:hypothetical protein
MLTKQDILDITGLDEKGFYKLYPSQKDFDSVAQAKYGKKIDKFLRKKSIEKAQTGWQDSLDMNPYNFNTGQKLTAPPIQMDAYDFDETQKSINKAANQNRRQLLRQGVGIDDPKGVMDESIQKSNLFQNMRNAVSEINSDNVEDAFQATGTVGANVQKVSNAVAAKKKAKEENKLLEAMSPLIAKASQGDMDKPQRRYRKPTDPDILIQPDTLHNPLGSGQGLYAKNGTEIANTFAPNTIYTDLEQAATGAEMALISEGINTAGDQIAWLLSRNTKKFQKENEKLMGKMAMQPMMQNLQANQFGSYMERGGMINPQVATELEGIPLTRLFAPDPYMDTLRTGGNIRQNNMAMGGNLKVDGRGDIEYMGYNPEVAKTGASGFIGISRGPSHDNGGFNIAYGENGFNSNYAKAGAQSNMPSPSIVEIEGGETVIESANGMSLQDKNLNILGNLKVGILDKSVSDGINETVMSEILKGRKLKDLKYKNLGNEIAKNTGRLNLAENKYLKLIESDDPLTSSSGKAGLFGVGKRYIDLKNLQDNLVNNQLAVNTTAEEMGLNPDKLAYRGKVEKAKTGGKLSTAQTGVTKSSKQTALDLYNSGKIKEFQEFTANNYPDMVKDVVDKYGTPKGGWPDGIEGFRTVDIANRIKDLPEYTFGSQPSASMIAGLEKIAGKLPNRSIGDLQSQITSDMSGLESQYSGIPTETKSGRFDKNIADSIMMYANQLLPFIRPSDAEGLSPEQIAGELIAMTDQVVPVQMQKFSPRLQSMRNVSFDEQYARNQDDFNAMIRRVGNNPSALSALGAEKYKADRQIADAAFKTNEGLAQATMAQNLEALNKADLINLELIDKQYGRQEQAISNTKATQQAALNSINAKILENRNLMNSLRTYENLYNYRFDKGFRATNMNPFATFNMEGSGSPGVSALANYTPEQLKLYAAQMELEKKEQEKLTKGSSKKSNGGLVQSYKNM